MDLREGPLARWCLTRCAQQEYLLTSVFHSIICDSRSLDIVFNELELLYRAAVAKKTVTLSPRPIQYATFAASQNASIDAQLKSVYPNELNGEMAFWKRRLALPLPVVELPADYPHKRGLRNRGNLRQQKIAIESATPETLKRSIAARVHESIPFLTTWVTLIHRYTGLDDLIIGIPTTGRQTTALMNVIGPFTNYLPLRVSVRAEAPFRDLLQQVNKAHISVQENSRIPLARLITDLQPGNSSSQANYFQTIFNYHERKKQKTLADLQAQPLHLALGDTHFEPSIAVHHRDDSFLVILDYNFARFERTTAQRLLEHWQYLLIDASQNSRKDIGSLHLMSPAARHQVSIEWHNFYPGADRHQHEAARWEYQGELTFLDFFSAQVASRGNSPAVIDADGDILSYESLDRRASLLAKEFCGVGVGPESIVAIMMGRSHDLITSIIAVLQAGGAYLPLEPSYPENRLTFMLSDADVTLLVTDDKDHLSMLPSGYISRWQGPAQKNIFIWQRQQTPGTSELSETPEPSGSLEKNIYSRRPPDASSTAYVIYTSGSTGRPKGVAVSHRALAWYCYACIGHYDLRSNDRVLQFASISFDISVGEIFPSLAAGAALVLRNEEMAASLHTFFERCRFLQVSVLLLPTAFWHEMTSELVQRGNLLPDTLRLLSFGGEQVQPEYITSWHRQVQGRVRLFNSYGPTEGTVEATVHPLHFAGKIRDSRIGRPIAGVRLALLDRAGRAVPPGVVGELQLTSPGLARGYLGQPRITARRFVPDSSSRIAGQRAYRTGDLAQQFPDGTLGIVGRVDDQIKHRGFRIELGEIENTLLRFSRIAQALVILRGPRLLAYLVATSEPPPAIDEIRSFLRQELPSYMIPSALTFLKHLPMTPGGKIHRAALPDIENSTVGTSTKDPLIKALLEIWKATLGNDSVSLNSNFFAEGGHSLLAAQLLARIRSKLGIEVSLRSFFDRPTLTELAAELRSASSNGSRPPLLAIPRDGPLPLSFAQQRLWFLDRLIPESSAYLLPAAITLRGELDHAVLVSALQKIIDRHETLRSAFPENVEGEPGQIHSSQPFFVPLIDLAALPTPRRRRETALWMAREAHTPIPLNTGPTLRCRLIRLGQRHHVLLRTIHHISGDAWSDEIFYRELSRLYRAGRSAVAKLSRLPIQYADFAVWQRRFLTRDTLREKISWWKRHLKTPPSRLSLPSDQPRNGKRDLGGERVNRRLPIQFYEQLTTVSQKYQATLHMTMLAAWSILIQNLTNLSDLIIGVPVSLRSQAETQKLIGCFVNTLPLRVQPTSNLSYEEFLKEVRDISITAYGNQEVPLEMLVEQLQPDRHLDANPLFQIMFNYHRALDTAGSQPTLDGLVIEPARTTQTSVHFEPSLTIEHKDNETLIAIIEYQPSLFDPETIDRILNGYTECLRILIKSPHQAISNTTLWNEQEKKQLLSGYTESLAARSPHASGQQTEEITHQLKKIWEKILGYTEVSVSDSFFTLGGDSILLMRLLAQARRQGLRISPREVFAHQSIHELALHLHHREPAEQEQVTPANQSFLPLTPIQRAFFALEPAEPWHYNQTMTLQPKRPLNIGALEKALGALVDRHEALRLQFTRTENREWQQKLDLSQPFPILSVIDIQQPPSYRRSLLQEEIADQIHASLNLENGPLLRAVALVDRQAPVIVLTVHHLAIDASSWAIFIEDLEEAYESFQTRSKRFPNPPATSFTTWALQLATRPPADINRCAAIATAARKTVRLPSDKSRQPGTVATERTLLMRLPREVTAILTAPLPYRARIDEVLLAALARVVCPWAGGQIMVEAESHGREDLNLNLSETVGWFTAFQPVILKENADPREAIRVTKEARRRVSALDWSLSGMASKVRACILFNYLGHLDAATNEAQLFRETKALGQETSPKTPRSHLLELNGGIRNGQIEMEWSWSDGCYKTSTIHNLTARFVQEVATLAEWCQSNHGGVTPSDFPMVSLTQAKLDRLVAHGSNVEDIYPLTPLQEGLLFHILQGDTSNAYFEQLSWVMANIDRLALRRAWEAVSARHTILRTRFVWQGLQRPVQIVERSLPFNQLFWREEDWRKLDPPTQDERFEALMKEERQLGFALEQAPLQRFILVQLDEHRYRLLWSISHLIIDGWSTPIVLDEVTKLYREIHSGQSQNLPKAPLFREYIAWLDRRDKKQDELFWRRYLAGFESPIPIADEKAPGLAHDTSTFLAEPQTEVIKAFARRHRITLNTVVQVVWALVLRRFSGLSDIVFGATVSGRPEDLERGESMVGLLANTIPFRVRLSSGQETSELLLEYQKQVIETRRYEHAALADIQHWSDVRPGTPLFESLLLFENYPINLGRDSYNHDPNELADAWHFSHTSYPLTLYVFPFDSMQLSLDFDAARMPATRAVRLLQAMLQALISLPKAPTVDHVQSLSIAEHHQICHEWSDSPSLQELVEAIPGRISRTATTNSNRQAIVQLGRSEESLTYGELEERAINIAGWLAAQGIGTGSVVGVSVPRGIDLIIALLAVWKTGAAYVPLDPTYPLGRRQHMVDDAGVELVLETLPFADTDKSFSPPHAKSLAYVIYTSGSTGKPKGVEISHQALAHFLDAAAQHHGLTRDDRIAALTTISFDIAGLEIWLPLSQGGSLLIADQETIDDAFLLKAALERHTPTVIQATPAGWRQLLNLGWRPSQDLTMLCGGEEMPPDLAADLLRLNPGSCWNLYGPTETTIWALAHRLSKSQPPVPIGRPLDGYQVLVLDSAFRPSPARAVGELHIGGQGLARGYRGLPVETARSFVPNPWSSAPGSRLYRTGDLVRFDSEGKILFLGRRDHQVKVRGFRIELGEVEVALRDLPGVRDAAVIVRGENVNKHLVAFLSTSQKRNREQDQANLKRRLPSYMVPTSFVIVEQLPMTLSGKVDRASLAASAKTVGSTPLDKSPPQGPTEQLVARIWSEILDLEEIYRSDNFFELGGHSLRATVLIARLREAFDVQLPLRAIFEDPVLHDIAQQVDSGSSRSSEVIPVLPRDQPLPLSPAQHSLWLLDQFGTGAHYNVHSALKIQGPLQVSALFTALDLLTARHEILRTVFNNGQQWPRPPQSQNWPIVDLASLPNPRRDQEEAYLHRTTCKRPFDLALDPAFRAILIRSQKETYLLIVVLHHIVIDGSSEAIFSEELCQLYNAAINEDVAPLPRLPIQYADFAAWQHEKLQGNDRSRLLTYWQSQLAKSSLQGPILETDRPRPVATSRKRPAPAGSVDLGLEHLTTMLRHIARVTRGTLFTVTLAGTAAVIGRYLQHDNVTIGTPMMHRPTPETERLIGLFANTVALPIDLSGSAQEALLKTRQVVLDAQAHLGLTIEDLTRELQPKRRSGVHAFFQVLFFENPNYDDRLQMADLKAEWQDTDSASVAPFDISVGISTIKNELFLDLSYDKNLFDRTTIERFARHIESLLTQLHHLQVPLKELIFLSPSERHQLAVEWPMEQHPATLVLDDNLTLVPMGSVGEIYEETGPVPDELGPRQTALRYVPHPWGPAGARLFRTGLLGKRHPSGAIIMIEETTWHN